jgi:hypothetical protein
MRAERHTIPTLRFIILTMSASLFRLIILLLITSSPALAQVTTWQPPDSYSSSKYYSVVVNGTKVPVYDTPIASYAVFDFSGKADVVVNTSFDVRWVDVRPLRHGIVPKYRDANTFVVQLKEPSHLSLELNGRIRQQPLFLLSGFPETDKPDRNDKNVIWFESGKLYDNVNLEIKSGQTVYVEGGAVVKGKIFANGQKNISIRGRGVLDGSTNKDTPGWRAVHFTDCKNVNVKDVVLHNGTTWQIAAFHCDSVSIQNVKIISESGGDDGMDIVRCRNVVVDNVFAHTKDDCIAIKSHGDYPPTEITDNILVKNCTFWNSLWGNAIEIGYELYSAEVKNVRFENIDIMHVEDGAAMSIHNAGPAHVHNVVFDNIRVEDCSQKLIDVAIFFSQWGPDGIRDKEFTTSHYLHGAWDGVQRIPEGKLDYHRKFRGTVSNVTFKNIQVVDGHLPFSVVHGFDDEHMVKGVTIENLTHMGKRIKASEAKIRTTFADKVVVK